MKRAAITAVLLILWTMFTFTAAWELGSFDNPQCQEDEVFAWHHLGGDFPSSIEWECVPLDDLR